MLSERASCGDCGVIEGQIHVDGCDMERCAFCGHQRISCDCSTRHFYPKMVDLFARRTSARNRLRSACSSKVGTHGYS